MGLSELNYSVCDVLSIRPDTKWLLFVIKWFLIIIVIKWFLIINGY